MASATEQPLPAVASSLDAPATPVDASGLEAAGCGSEAEELVRSRLSTAAWYRSNLQNLEDGQRLLFISDNLPCHELLVRAAKDNIVLVPVQFNSWSLDQVKAAAVLRAGEPEGQFDTVGWLDHGRSGEFALLNSIGSNVDIDVVENNESVREFLKWLASYVSTSERASKWQTDITKRVDLMGCDIAKDDKGEALMAKLEEVTGVNWAASNNKTGNIDGCDWIMESEIDLGDIASHYFQRERLGKWQHCASDNPEHWVQGAQVVADLIEGFAVLVGHHSHHPPPEEVHYTQPAQQPQQIHYGNTQPQFGVTRAQWGTTGKC